MISIPAVVRKKYHISDGDYVIVKEDESGTITLIPVESAEDIRKNATTVAEFKDIFRKSKQEDLESEL